MNIAILYYLPALIGILLIAVFVILRQRHPVYISFSLMFFVIVLWQWLQLLSILIPIDTALWLMRLSLLLSNLIAPLFFIFALLYPNSKRWPDLKNIILIILPAILLSLLSFSPSMISGLEKYGNEIVLHTGFMYDVQTIIVVLYFVIALSILAWKYRQARGNERAAILLLLIAFFIPLVVGILANYIWINIPGAQNIFPVSLFVTSIIVAYAIVRHKLFDIRLVIARAVAYLMLTFTLLVLYAGAVLISTQLLFGDLSEGVVDGRAAVYFIFALLLALTFNPLKNFFDSLTNRIFFRHEYDLQEIIIKMGDVTSNEMEIDTLSHKSTAILQDALKTSYVHMQIESYKEAPERHVNVGQTISIDKKTLETARNIEDKIIIVDRLDDAQERLRKKLEAKEIAAIIRMSTSRHTVGYVFLGQKLNGRIYNKKDKNLLNAVGNELAVAIQNSLRFEEIQNFNETLQKEVETKTRSLRRANERLRQLDEIKDEFITMASHQLRTPLTSIKGYTSMLLDGDGGKLSEVQARIMKEVFLSSERMSRLINDFLNISRLRTGKFVIEPSTVDFAHLVEREVEQLQGTAKVRGVKLNFDKPENIPTVEADEEKMQQVVMNLLDNAIYYSKVGTSVNIELMKRKGEIVLKVKDHGIGVPDKDKPHLFTKFYRGSNAKKQRPDGTGIGLFMAQKVVTSHGGVMIFESKEGKGSTFGFTIPLKPSKKHTEKDNTSKEKKSSQK